MKKRVWYIDRDEHVGKVVESELPKLTDAYEPLIIVNPIVIDDKLKERLPAIIFIDCAIAEQDNGIIIKDLRTNKNMQKIPFVMLGTDIRLEDRAQALGVHALRKPFDMAQFLEKIKELGV